MSQETGQEKTEEPTPKRLREAREKGQVARSKELNSMMLLMSAGFGMMLLGGSVLTGLREMMERSLTIHHADLYDNGMLISAFGDMLADSMIMIAPILMLLFVIVLLTPLGIGGWSFSLKAISPKLEKLDPVKGMGRVFSLKGLMELAKVLAKFALVGFVSAIILYSILDQILQLSHEPLAQAMEHVAELCGWTFLACSSALIFVALIDVPFQLWQHKKQLMMTRQEVKDENKETEGNPEMKAKLRQTQHELSRRRMMDAVPEADVVITNPTHYAVALKYDQFNMQAPIVVAKGADLIAAQIREVATENDVAIVEAPPLARALYATTDIDQEIPAGLYIAVATILSYVYQLKASLYTDIEPELPEDLEIPEEFSDMLKPDDDQT